MPTPAYKAAEDRAGAASTRLHDLQRAVAYCIRQRRPQRGRYFPRRRWYLD
jgi:hypothetical protein